MSPAPNGEKEKVVLGTRRVAGGVFLFLPRVRNSAGVPRLSDQFQPGDGTRSHSAILQHHPGGRARLLGCGDADDDVGADLEVDLVDCPAAWRNARDAGGVAGVERCSKKPRRKLERSRMQPLWGNARLRHFPAIHGGSCSCRYSPGWGCLASSSCGGNPGRHWQQPEHRWNAYTWIESTITSTYMPTCISAKAPTRPAGISRSPSRNSWKCSPTPCCGWGV